jgi:hypothetical protein
LLPPQGSCSGSAFGDNGRRGEGFSSLGTPEKNNKVRGMNAVEKVIIFKKERECV